MKKRLLVMALCVVLLCGLLPVTAFAEVTTESYGTVFTTFEDLKSLCADAAKALEEGSSEAFKIWYNQSEVPLVMEEDLVIPGNVHLFLDRRETEVTIPEGVTVTMNDGAWMGVSYFIVEGTFVNYSSIQTPYDITVTGAIRNGGVIHLSKNSTLTGKENVIPLPRDSGSDNVGYISVDWYCTDAAGAYAAIAAAEENPEFSYYIRNNGDLDLTITEDLTMPDNIYFSLQKGFNLTVAEGCTLDVSEIHVYGTLTIEGKLVARDYIGIWTGSSKGHMIIADTGSVEFGDSITVQGEFESKEEAITGLDWSQYTVDEFVEEDYGFYVCFVYNGTYDEPVFTQPFQDVSENDYFFEPVLWALDWGVTTGLSDTEFGPDQDCTRGQVVTFLWRAAGQPEPTSTENPFTDVSESDYFYKAVLWAVEKGITNGYGAADTFSPEVACTRGQVATFLWRAAGQPEPTSTENPFQDVSESDYFFDAVLWAVEKGVTNGYGSADTFSPETTCTRGQVVTFLYRSL